MLTKKLLSKSASTLAASLAIISIFCCVRPAQAVPGPGVFTINIAPDGLGNVVANGSGDVNLGAAGVGSLFTTASAQMSSASDLIENGPVTNTSILEYTFSSALTGPGSFGTGFPGLGANSGSGTMFLFSNPGFGSFVLGVPSTYTTDTVISNTSTYTGRTLASLGLTAPNTYTWTMGTGNTENTVIINVSATPAPEPASFALAGLGAAAMLFLRRRASREKHS